MMNTFSCKVQLSNFYPDQFENKGVVDVSEAIDVFQQFQWDDEVFNYQNKVENITVPKIIFNNNNIKLSIYTKSLKGFYLLYENLELNQYSDFFISNDFQTSNFNVEEIIEYLFDGTIETYLELDTTEIPKIEKDINEPKNVSKNLEFSYHPNHLKIMGYMPFIWFSVSIGFLIYFGIDYIKLTVFLHIIISLFWLPLFILHLTYIIKNKNSKVIIDTNNHQLTYSKGDKEISFSRDDIFRCQIVTSESTTTKYSYIWFILNDRTYVTITSFVADPYDIADALNCKYIEKTKKMPYLPII